MPAHKRQRKSLYFSGAKDATVVNSKIGNYSTPNHPETEGFGDASIFGDNGAVNYFRVDWYTPDGLGAWGDGRLFIVGTNGYIELRKYINDSVENTCDHILAVTGEKEEFISVAGKVGRAVISAYLFLFQASYAFSFMQCAGDYLDNLFTYVAIDTA